MHIYIHRDIITIHLKMTEVWSKRRVLSFIFRIVHTNPTCVARGATIRLLLLIKTDLRLFGSSLKDCSHKSNVGRFPFTRRVFLVNKHQRFLL